MVSGKIRKFLDESDALVDEAYKISQDDHYWRHYEMAMIDLELQVMKSMLKDCQVYLSGLHAIGLSTASDNIHLHVDIGSNYYKKTDIERDIGQMMFLVNVLERSGSWIINSIFKGSPAIRCVYKNTNQRFIINIGNGYKIQVNKILGHLFKIQQEAKRLYHFLRMYIIEKHCCKIKYNLLMIFVIFYLQQMRLLPSLDEVQSSLTRVFIDGKL